VSVVSIVLIQSSDAQTRRKHHRNSSLSLYSSAKTSNCYRRFNKCQKRGDGFPDATWIRDGTGAKEELMTPVSLLSPSCGRSYLWIHTLASICFMYLGFTSYLWRWRSIRWCIRIICLQGNLPQVLPHNSKDALSPPYSSRSPARQEIDNRMLRATSSELFASRYSPVHSGRTRWLQAACQHNPIYGIFSRGQILWQYLAFSPRTPKPPGQGYRYICGACQYHAYFALDKINIWFIYEIWSLTKLLSGLVKKIAFIRTGLTGSTGFGHPVFLIYFMRRKYNGI